MNNALKILSLLSIVTLAIAVSYPTFAIEYKVTTDNSKVECREGQTLIYRFYSRDYFCINSGTAVEWIQRGLAKLPEKSIIIPQTKELDEIIKEKPGLICKKGQVLAYRVNTGNNVCLTEKTAEKWMRIGLAKIIDSDRVKHDKTMENPDSNIEVNIKNKITIEPKSINEKVQTKIKQEKINEENKSDISVQGPRIETNEASYVIQKSIEVLPNTPNLSAIVWCNANDYTTGGGYTVEKGWENVQIYKNGPIKNPPANLNGWEIKGYHNGKITQALMIYVICQVP